MTFFAAHTFAHRFADFLQEAADADIVLTPCTGPDGFLTYEVAARADYGNIATIRYSAATGKWFTEHPAPRDIAPEAMRLFVTRRCLDLSPHHEHLWEPFGNPAFWRCPVSPPIPGGPA